MYAATRFTFGPSEAINAIVRRLMHFALRFLNEYCLHTESRSVASERAIEWNWKNEIDRHREREREKENCNCHTSAPIPATTITKSTKPMKHTINWNQQCNSLLMRKSPIGFVGGKIRFNFSIRCGCITRKTHLKSIENPYYSVAYSLSNQHKTHAF